MGRGGARAAGLTEFGRRDPARISRPSQGVSSLDWRGLGPASFPKRVTSMAYATIADVRAKWSAQAVDLLAWDDAAGAPDENKISIALAQAAAIMDSYIGRRYPLPVDPQPDTRLLLQAINCDLAVSSLANTPAARNEIIIAAEKSALTLLRDISEGRAALNLVPPQGSGAPIAPGQAVVMETDGWRRERLEGFW